MLARATPGAPPPQPRPSVPPVQALGAAQTPDRTFLVRVSYLEIYNETIRDLLEPGTPTLTIHQSVSRGVYVDGKDVVVSSAEELMACLQRGEALRKVGETDMNKRSSRSHTIFRITVESRPSRAKAAPAPEDAQDGSGAKAAPSAARGAS